MILLSRTRSLTAARTQRSIKSCSRSGLREFEVVPPPDFAMARRILAGRKRRANSIEHGAMNGSGALQSGCRLRMNLRHLHRRGSHINRYRYATLLREEAPPASGSTSRWCRQEIIKELLPSIDVQSKVVLAGAHTSTLCAPRCLLPTSCARVPNSRPDPGQDAAIRDTSGSTACAIMSGCRDVWASRSDRQIKQPQTCVRVGMRRPVNHAGNVARESFELGTGKAWMGTSRGVISLTIIWTK